MGSLGGRAPAGLLLALGALLSACSRSPRQLPVGLSLEALPQARGAPLVALVPTGMFVVAALHDPRRTLEAIEGSELARRMKGLHLFDDQVAWPWVERWQVLRSRLGELSRQPIPDLTRLLEAPAVVSLSSEGSWLYVARTSAGPAVAFATALNGVHPSGREVELERRHGIPLRLIRFGEGRLLYYVLADRLVVSDDLSLLQRSLDLFFSDNAHASARGSPRLAGLEAEAELSGLALAVDGSRAPLSVLGLRALTAGPDSFAADFDPQRWASPQDGSPEIAMPGDTDALALRIDLTGLQAAAVWQAVRPPGATSSLLSALDGVAGELGRGVWLRAREEADGRVAFSAWFASPERAAPDPELSDSRPGNLARLLLSDPSRATAVAGNGTSWCAAGGGLCLVACPRLLGITNRGESLSGCPELRAPAPDEAWLSMEVSGGGSPTPFVRLSASASKGLLRWAGP